MSKNLEQWLDLALGAGIIEGEGSVHVSKRNKRGYLYLECAMTDKDIIEKLQRIFKAGTITSRRPHKTSVGTTLQWRWRVNMQKEVRRILLDILPFMGLRRTARILSGDFRTVAQTPLDNQTPNMVECKNNE